MRGDKAGGGLTSKMHWRHRIQKFYSFGFVALVFVAIGYVLWSSLGFQECIKSCGQYDPTSKHFEKSISTFIIYVPIYRHCIGSYITANNAVITAIGTLVIAVFTTILGIFTVSLARSTRAAADAAKHSADITLTLQSPSLYIRSAHFERAKERPTLVLLGFADVAADLPAIAYIEFENFGLTPAIVRSFCIEWKVVLCLPPNPEYTCLRGYTVGIPRGEVRGMFHDGNTISLTKEELDAIDDGRTKLWVYGYVDYRDFLRRKHRVGFCLSWFLGTGALAAGLTEDKDGPEAYIYQTELPDT